MAISNTFAVTAMGRSGTQFLSHVLDSSPTRTVKHEPIPGFHSLAQVQQRFNRSNYGEVNSFLRFQLFALDVKNKAVIVRDPMQIFASMYNRGKDDIAHLNEALIAIDALIQSGIPVIQFSLMTSDEKYLRDCATTILGITDLPKCISLSAINTSKHSKQLPPQTKKLAAQKTDWFRRLYHQIY
jgi:hypothetical protein